MNAMHLRQQIRALNIGPDHLSEPLELTGDPAGAVVAGCLVALGNGVSEQHQRDVLQCLLLAQLAANPKADRHKDPTNWYKTYQQTLEQVGWVVQGSFAMSRHLSPGTRFTMSDAVTDQFRRRLGAGDLPLVTDVLNAFKDDRTSPGQFVFECPSHQGGIGNFQFALATEEDGNLSLHIGRFTFNVPNHVTRLAFEEFPPDAQFQAGFTSMALNEQVYGGVRNAITTKLGSRLQAQVAMLTPAGPNRLSAPNGTSQAQRPDVGADTSDSLTPEQEPEILEA
jgi:hypothetical protein